MLQDAEMDVIVEAVELGQLPLSKHIVELSENRRQYWCMSNTRWSEYKEQCIEHGGLHDIATVSAVLGVSRQYVYKMIYTKKLKALKLNKRTLVLGTSIDAWLEYRKQVNEAMSNLESQTVNTDAIEAVAPNKTTKSKRKNNANTTRKAKSSKRRRE